MHRTIRDQNFERSFKIIATERKKLAERIKQLQPKASPRPSLKQPGKP